MCDLLTAGRIGDSLPMELCRKDSIWIEIRLLCRHHARHQEESEHCRCEISAASHQKDPHRSQTHDTAPPPAPPKPPTQSPDSTTTPAPPSPPLPQYVCQ